MKTLVQKYVKIRYKSKSKTLDIHFKIKRNSKSNISVVYVIGEKSKRFINDYYYR